MTYVKIGDKQIEAFISGRTNDLEWGNRESKSIKCEMTYPEAVELFVDGVKWSIVQQDPAYIDPETNEMVVPEPIEYDNSDYSISGSITDNRNGTVTVKMGKPTEVEVLQMQLANAVTEEELETAYIEGVNSL